MDENIVPVDVTPLEKDGQIDLAKELQAGLLRYFKQKLRLGTLTPTDAKTLSALLSQNGWSIDEATLPQHLRDKLTKKISAADIDEDGVIGRIA